MILQETFIRNLKKLRGQAGLSQMRLAELCRSSTSYIGELEIGKKSPSMEMIEKIAKALRIRPTLFFFDEKIQGQNFFAVYRKTVPPETKAAMFKQLAALRRITANIYQGFKKY